MKRYGQLWDHVVRWENLMLAARRAQRGKRSRMAVASFNFRQERQLLRIQEELEAGTYRPGGFRTHWITIPKPRLISAAPYRDRVVHHALMNILEPILDRHFHADSYACRKGKGTLAAAERLQTLMGRNRFALQCDIRRFFPSIDHESLKEAFRRLIKDRRVLALMDLIVDHSNEQPGQPDWFPGDNLFTPLDRRRGLPIGNLTSQWFANWMLNKLDHFITSHLGIGSYLRYCDDFVLLQDDRGALRDAVPKITDELARIRLRMHGERAVVRPVRDGLTFVGFRTWATHRLVRKDNVRRFRRRVRGMKTAYAKRTIDWDYIKPRLMGWIAHARNANSEMLIRRMSREWRFSRGGAKQASCDSRRRVEQQCHELPVYEPQQQHAVQSEQQQRIPLGPALSEGVKRHRARNRTIHGSCERGEESPGSAPVPGASEGRTDGRICPPGPGGSGRHRAEGPIRSLIDGVVKTAA